MARVRTNIQVIRRSRHKPAPGEVFAMQLPDEAYLFGRVIDVDLDSSRAPMPGCHLIYVYSHRSTTMEPVLEELRPDRLLIPPLFINTMPWTRGYFNTVAHQPLAADDLLDQHCFWDLSLSRFVDEFERPLPQESHPCGDWGLHSYRTLDDAVSEALGIPLIPEDE